MAAAPSLARAARVRPFPASAGAERARALYERHERSVYAFCLHRLADRQDAEDATQATFLNALRSLERGVEPELESAWLLAIAKRVVLNRRRAAARRRRVETPDDLAGLGELVAAPSQRADELVRLRESLSSLPEQQRRALILREWQGLTYHEIAAELGLSHAAVETLLFRARRMLASELTTPQRSKRRGLLKTLNLGPLLSAVKSLFGAGAVKLAVVVAVAIAGSSAHVGRRPVDKEVAAAAALAAPSVRAS